METCNHVIPQMNKIYVTLKGTVVDGMTKKYTDDFEEWVCLNGVEIEVDGQPRTTSGADGEFSYSDTYEKSKLKPLLVSFKKEDYRKYDVRTTISASAEEARSGEMYLFVEMMK